MNKKNVFTSSLILGVLSWMGFFGFYLAKNLGQLAAPSWLVVSLLGVLAGAGIWFIAGLRLNELRNGRLLSMLVAISMVYAVEVGHYAMFWYPGFPRLSPPLHYEFSLVKKAIEQGIRLDSRSAFEVVRDLRLRNIDAYPAFLVAQQEDWTSEEVFKSQPLIWPLGGISTRTIVHCNESGFWSIYESDINGFNNPSQIWEAPINQVLLGDSFVHGACVREGDDFGGKIRKYFPQTYNLGQRGNGPLLNLAAFTEYAKDRRPQNVVWFYTEGNDLPNLRKELSLPFLKQYLNPLFSQNLVAKRQEIDEVIRWAINKHWERLEAIAEPTTIQDIRYVIVLRSLRKRFGLEVRENKVDPNWKVEQNIKLLASVGGKKQKNLQMQKTSARTDPLNEDSDQQNTTQFATEEKIFFQILSRVSDEIRSWNGRLFFVYLPSATRYSGEVRAPASSRPTVLSLVSRLPEVAIIDGHQLFLESGDPMQFFPFRSGGHYNEAGYGVIARAVVDKLRQNEH